MVAPLIKESNTHPPVSKVVIITGEILKLAKRYMPEAEIYSVKRAALYAVNAHNGQDRESGELFVEHPLRTTRTLAEWGMDVDTLIAGLLHDVVEDCPHITNEDIRREFGPVVAKLVEGVTKIEKEEAEQLRQDSMRGIPEDPADRFEKDATNRKVVVDMAEDPRVAIIKLADRLDNMQTLDALPEEKRISKAQETQEIYIPIANCLGMWEMKRELEDLVLKYIEPGTDEKIGAHENISGMLKDTSLEREEYIGAIRSKLQATLDNARINAKVTGHTKNIYAIHEFEKRRHQNIGVNDMFTLRVIAQGVQDCYNALGVVHTLWRPMPGQFDDYISNPKDNHYKSLHTTVSVDSDAVEVHIRTIQMDRVAEYGFTANWRFKDGGTDYAYFNESLKIIREQILKLDKETRNSKDFTAIAADKFQEQIYVYTHEGEGDYMEVPVGATPLDFAYHINPYEGRYCIGAEVNGILVGLTHQLQNGDYVKIITDKDAQGPERKWLNPDLGYLNTAFARAQVKAWFSGKGRAENIEAGETIFSSQIRRLNPFMRAEIIAEILGFDSKEDFLVALSCGVLTCRDVVERIANWKNYSDNMAYRVISELPDIAMTSENVLGRGNTTYIKATCCKPKTGDAAVVYPNPGDSPEVHRVKCDDIASKVDTLSPVNWDSIRIERTTEYIVPLRVEARERRGLIKDIVSLVWSEGADVVEACRVDGGDLSVSMPVRVDGMLQLYRICSKIEDAPGVLSVTRQ